MNDHDTDPKARLSKGTDRPQPDATDYGQPAGSPGGRGGTTCYGGIRRVSPRTSAKDAHPADE